MAEAVHPHPDLDQLRVFSLGKLDDEAASALIEAHLETCAECRRRLEGVPGDTLDNLLRSADTAVVDPPPTELPPVPLTDHPRYEIRKLLGGGGMGTVYQARHKLMDRDVALKVIHPRLVDRPATVERFRREVRAAARLAHPNIVTAHDADQAGDLHFLIMEFVAGQSLAEVMAERGALPVAEACDYIRQAALGLQHAHEQGMVHRDVKPANLLVVGGGTGESPATVKIVDFGLARLVLDREVGDAVTREGAVMGTPDYMAPEQAGDPHSADIRADVYSLGCTLYHLLTGRPPFPIGSMMQKLVAHQMHQPRPLTELRADVPADLVRVVERMMDKDPARRYQTPGEVARELAAFLQTEAANRRGQPRRRWLVAAAAALLSIAAGVVGVIVYRVQTDRGEIVVKVEGDDVAVQLEKGGVKVVDKKTGRKYDLRPGNQGLKTGEYLIEVTEDAGGLKFSTREFTIARGGKQELTVILQPIIAALKTGEPLSPLALVAAPAKLNGNPSWTIETVHQRGVLYAVDLSPDGKLLAAGGEDGTIRLWDTKTGRLARALVGHRGPISFLAWLPDGKSLVSGASADGGIQLWDTAAGKVMRTFGKYAEPYGLDGSFSTMAALRPDGTALALVEGNRIHLWEVSTGKPLQSSPDLGKIFTLAWSPDGQTLALGRRDGEVSLWPVGAAVGVVVPCKDTPQTRGSVFAVAWSSDGKTLAAGGDMRSTIGIWDIASRKLLRTLEKGEGKLYHYQLKWTSADQALVLTVKSGEAVKKRVIDAASGKVLSEEHVSGTQTGIVGRGDAPDGSMSWFADRGTIYTGPAVNKLKPLAAQHRKPQILAWSGTGEKVACGGGLLSVWQPKQGTLLWNQEQWGPSGWHQFAVSAAFSPDEMVLAAGSSGGHLWVYDVRTGQRIVEQQAHKGSGGLSVGWVRSVAWSPDSKLIATAGEDKVVRIWEANPFRAVTAFEGHEGQVWSLAWSPDGKTLASGSEDGTVRLWDVAARKHIRTHKGNLKQVYSVAWSPDGKTLAAGGNIPLVQLWSAESGEPLPCQASFSAGRGDRRVVWSSDGKTLACTWHTGARLHDAKTWELRQEVAGTGFSPDLTMYFTLDGYRLCETATGRCVGSLVPLRGGRGLAISAEGHYQSSAKEVEQQLVYVVQTGQGQETLSPEEFAKKYDWRNEPERVRLTGK